MCCVSQELRQHRQWGKHRLRRRGCEERSIWSFQPQHRWQNGSRHRLVYPKVLHYKCTQVVTFCQIDFFVWTWFRIQIRIRFSPVKIINDSLNLSWDVRTMIRLIFSLGFCMQCWCWVIMEWLYWFLSIQVGGAVLGIVQCWCKCNAWFIYPPPS